jgi:hypothetical protein
VIANGFPLPVSNDMVKGLLEKLAVAQLVIKLLASSGI